MCHNYFCRNISALSARQTLTKKQTILSKILKNLLLKNKFRTYKQSWDLFLSMSQHNSSNSVHYPLILWAISLNSVRCLQMSLQIMCTFLEFCAESLQILCIVLDFPELFLRILCVFLKFCVCLFKFCALSLEIWVFT